MKGKKAIKAAAVLLAALTALLASALAFASCGGNGRAVDTVVKNADEVTKARNDVSEDDRTGYIAAIEKYVEYLNGNAEAMRDMRPAEFFEEFSITPDEFVELLKKNAESSKKGNVEKYGEGYTVTYEVVSEKNYAPMLDSLRSTLQEKQNIAPEKVQKAYSVYVTITIKGPVSETSRSAYIIPANVDGKWYLFNVAGEFC